MRRGQDREVLVQASPTRSRAGELLFSMSQEDAALSSSESARGRIKLDARSRAGVTGGRDELKVRVLGACAPRPPRRGS